MGSQVACVNFLLPLAGIPERCYLPCALLMMTSWVSSPSPTMDAHPTWSSSAARHSLEGGRTRGSQNTSIDAFLVAETIPGRRRAYLLEDVEQYLKLAKVVVIAVPESYASVLGPQMVASDMPGRRRRPVADWPLVGVANYWRPLVSGDSV